jgi:ribonucleoside-triphosphate reductase (thioredoxin)
MQLLDSAGSKVKFTLDPDFISHYSHVEPPFGFNGLGALVYLRTYSRLKEDGSNEQWFETVQRVVEGTYSMQQRWIKANGLHWNPRKAQRSAQEMYTRIFTMKFLPPGRGLWAMGSALTEERGLWAALNNCAFVSTATLAKDLAEPFTFLMDASMLGIGVGFDTKGAGKIVITKPDDRDGVMLNFMVIPDTREGWVLSVELLLNSYFAGENAITFDYSEIRQAGLPIKGFGGVSSGPAPLKELHQTIRKTLDPCIGESITVTNIVDLMNLIGKCVVAGNVRRTAEIVFGEAGSQEYLDLKNYAVNPTREEFGWTSNNSVFAEVGMDYSEAAKRIAVNGEPGFAWLDNMQGFGRMADRKDYPDWRAMGGNPCLEQTLESYELCCLVETFPANHDSLEDYQTTLKFAYLYAKTVTLGRTPWARTNSVMLRNRRIGLSQSGIVQAIEKLGIETYREWCEEGYQTVQRYDEIYSDWFAIPRSIKTTSVKPSGTVSLLAGATPGMHYPEARTYVRRMRLSRYSELIQPLIDAGYPVEPAYGSEETTLVVEIPVKIADEIRTAKEVSMWEQLALAAFLQRFWSDNQVSATITFDPETEGPEIANALNFYQYQLKGISFLPRTELGAYRQMPYEAITETEYETRASELKPLILREQHEDSQAELYCNNDSCMLT